MRRAGTFPANKEIFMYNDLIPITLQMVTDEMPLSLVLARFVDSRTSVDYKDGKPIFTYERNPGTALGGWSKPFARRFKLPARGTIEGPFPLINRNTISLLLQKQALRQGRASQNLWKVLGYFIVQCYFFEGFDHTEEQIATELKLSRITVHNCISWLLAMDFIRISKEFRPKISSRVYFINLKLYSAVTRQQGRIYCHGYDGADI